MNSSAFSAPDAPARKGWIILFSSLGLGILLIWAGSGETDPKPAASKVSLPEEAAFFNIMGVVHLGEGFVREGLILLSNLPESDRTPMNLALSGLAHSAMRQKEVALACYEKAGKLREGLIPVQLEAFEETKGNTWNEEWIRPEDSLSGESLFVLGLWLASKERIEPGLKMLEAARKEGFHESFSAAALCAVNARAGRYGPALEWAERLWKSGAKNAALLMKTRVHLNIKNSRKTFSSLNRLPPSVSGSPYALWLRGQALAKVANEAEGETFLYRALVKDNDYTPAHLALGGMYMRQGRLDAAGESLDRVLNSGSRSRKALSLRAMVHIKMKEEEEAASLWHEILFFDPEHAEVLTNLGFHYLKAKTFHKAHNLFTRALKAGGEVQVLFKGITASDEGISGASSPRDTLNKMDRAVPRNNDIQLLLLKELEDNAPPDETDQWLARALASNTLSPAGHLVYLKKAVQAPLANAKTVSRNIVMNLVRQKEGLTVTVLIKAKEILLTKRPDGEKIWTHSVLRALAGKACIVSKGKNMKAVSLLVSILLESGHVDEAENSVLLFLRDDPKNKHLQRLLKEIRAKK